MLRYKNTCYRWTELNPDNSRIGLWDRDLLGVQFRCLFSFFLGLSVTIPSLQCRMVIHQQQNWQQDWTSGTGCGIGLIVEILWIKSRRCVAIGVRLHSRGWACRYTAATHCNTLQYTATHCNTLQHTASLCNTLQYTATHCNTLRHTATHCNTLQHTATQDIMDQVSTLQSEYDGILVGECAVMQGQCVAACCSECAVTQECCSAL